MPPLKDSTDPGEPRPWAPQSLQDLLDIARRHHRRALFAFLGVLALVGAGLALTPSVYQSEAKLYVRVGRESIGLDPTATTGQTISVSDSREFEMNSVMDVIDSRVVFEKVVDTLGVDTILAGRLPKDAATAATPPSVSISPVPPSRSEFLRRDQAVQALMDSIRTNSGKRSSVISITSRSATPDLAQRILQTFLESFQALHLNANRASGSYGFFAEQTQLLAEQLDSATRVLGSVKNRISVGTVEGRQKTLEDQYAAIHAAMSKNASSLAASEATIADLQRAMATLPDRIVSQEVTGFPDDAIGATRKHLAELRLKEQETLAKFTAQHPHVIAIRQQITAAEQLIAQNAVQVNQATRSTNPNREQLHFRLLSEHATAAALRAEADSLRTQSLKVQRQLAELNDQDSEIARLQQRVDVLKATLKGYTEKLEQSRIDQALAKESISNVSVVQPATLSLKPVGPKRGIVLMAGLVVALLSAVGVILGSEYLRPELLRRPFRLAGA